MISITQEQECCGCTACASICPKHCIVMTEDSEGFKYPVVNEGLCVNCNACVDVCPVINIKPARVPMQCYAAINNDKAVLMNSSSGGVFSVMAEYVITKKQGVVFGAKWDNEKVVHGFAETMDDVVKFRGSKYVQSDLGNCFLEVKEFLKSSRFVLFSGTPCEVGGLKSFLKRDYDNLLTVDVACHGVPSPKVLELYLQTIKIKYNVDTVTLNFKDKQTGWLTYSITALSGDKELFSELAVSQNPYMVGYLHELFSRPSCHHCVFKSFRSQSDFTIADFWGIDQLLPDINTASGVSLICFNTIRATSIQDYIEANNQTIKVQYPEAISNNRAIIQSEEAHPQRKLFFQILSSSDVLDAIQQALHLRPTTSILIKIKSKLKSIRH